MQAQKLAWTLLSMAGQWVEPGGGVVLAVMSGRQAVQLICDAEGHRFVPTGRS